MARPLWFRLFGENGPTTIAELRDALMNTTFGQGIGDGHITRRLFELSGIAPPASGPRPSARDDAPAREVAAGLVTHEQPGLATAVTVEHDLRAAAPDTARPPADPAPERGAADAAAGIADPDSDRAASLHLNGLFASSQLAAIQVSPLARFDGWNPYVVIGDPQSGLVVDTRTKSVMPGGPGDYPELFSGPNDIVELAGDYSAGFTFFVPLHVEQVMLRGGYDYNLIAGDDTVGAGGLLTINAMPLRDANHVWFDGSGETDGSFLFYGSDAGDVFLGGAGDDIIYGLGGADILSGGGGSDTFAYYAPAQSTGAAYDILADFDPATDRIDLEVTVTGFDAAIAGGTLSAASFDTDLAAALSGLGAGRAVYYAPDAGDLAGNVFLIVDANGIAGYQEGEDYVFALPGASLEDLSGHTDFFI